MREIEELKILQLLSLLQELLAYYIECFESTQT
jgi:hypothetical protein